MMMYKKDYVDEIHNKTLDADSVAVTLSQVSNSAEQIGVYLLI